MTCNRWHPGGATAGSGSGQTLVKLGSARFVSGFFILKQKPLPTGLQVPASPVGGMSEAMAERPTRSRMLRSPPPGPLIAARVRHFEKCAMGPLTRVAFGVVAIAVQTTPSSLTSMRATWSAVSGGDGKSTVAGMVNCVPAGAKLETLKTVAA